ncbi:monocarboxylate uptake permease MctP [Granulicella mallensis]|uniref:SSS family solute:Na+ symporter n=1 Tax=Granulicella mallensis TaxID=940614 RepID=A0A7W8EBG8_9BACT|nr:sodium:solute symporter [Granulicella mallensis]MBB5065569.1 SSS family solute:Na+ symporter [Granulicella mallensis]
MHTTALAVFCFFFLFVTVAGFMAARWRRPDAGMHSLEEWGLAGRSFGTWITWFLVGGDLYTAYTVIAVPAALYGAGAMGFFALPYVIIAYPYMMVVMPRLWRVCQHNGYVTLADFVRGRYGNRWLAVAIAVTGILALMPYIALQLVGMRVVFSVMGLHGEAPLVIAFLVLAAYTYSSGLRAPAVIAIVKDVMLYIMVAAAIILLPIKLGGYAHIFTVANQQLSLHTPPGSIFLRPQQFLGYSTLAIGSAIALMLYPHTATAILSARDGNVIRRNAALLPAYSFLLGLVALLGFIALAAGVATKDTSAAVPLLFLKMFPEWFAGFCLAAIAVGALVPAAIMSIAAANLFTRNLLGEFRRTRLSDRGESTTAKIVSLAVKFGALAFVLKLPTPYAIEMQLLGGIWIAQLFPSVVIGAFTRWMNPWALLCGWAAGMFWGTQMAVSLGLKSSVYPLHLFGGTYAMYAAVPALLLNLLISTSLTLLLRSLKVGEGSDATVSEDYA